MKVVFAADEYPPYILGGSGRHSYYITRELSKSVDITVITPKRKSHFRLYEKIPKRILIKRFSFLDIPGFRVPSMGWGIYRFYKKRLGSFDLIHSQNNAAFLISPERIPKIESVHHTIKSEIKRIEKTKIISLKDMFCASLYYKFLLKLERRNSESVDHFIAVSNYTKDALINEYGINSSNITVIPNGVDANKFRIRPRQKARKRLKLPLDKRILLVVSRLERRKNVASLISALKLLRRNDTILVICGEGEYSYKLRELTVELKLNNNVMFTGIVNDNLLPLYYNAADLYVLPSVIEGFGLTLLESMASGTPVVASKVCAIPEVTDKGKSAMLAEEPTPNKLAMAINEVLTNEDLYERLKIRGMNHVKEAYSWSAAAKKTLEIYEKVLNKR